MTEAPRSLTLEMIKQQFPPTEVTFAAKGGVVVASVSRNELGTIVYVVPGSAKLIKDSSNEVSSSSPLFNPNTQSSK